MMAIHHSSFVEGGPSGEKAYPKPAFGIVCRDINQPSKILKFADGTEKCEIRRDIHAMGGNCSRKSQSSPLSTNGKAVTGVIAAGVQVSKVCSTRASPPRGVKRCPVGGQAGRRNIPRIYGSLSQLAEENGSNPFQFRFESEVNYQNLKFFQISDIIYLQSERKTHLGIFPLTGIWSQFKNWMLRLKSRVSQNEENSAKWLTPAH